MSTPKHKLVYTIISWLITLVVPVAVILTAVRLVLAPWYVEFEYRTPNFPADRYGFTREERLMSSKIAMEHQVDASISFLEEQRFPEGQQVPEPSCQFMQDCTFMYNARELEHMLDVKVVTQAALRVWLASLLVLVGLGIWARLGGWWDQYRLGLSRGGWLTLILIAGLILFVLVGFGVAFVLFHEIFFDPGTWRFLFSDTLIRLFPQRFWRDTFLVVGLFAAGMAFCIGYFARIKR
jgi:integral membrane protein (TIGR01906 family)